MIDELKYCVQLFLAKRQMKEVEVKRALGELAPDRDLLVTIQDINSQLAGVNLKITRTVCEISDEIYYVMVPLTYKEESFKQSLFTENELGFFKKIIIHILETGEGTINGDSLEQLKKECSLSNVGADGVINKLVDSKYIIRMEEELALTPLCVAEFTTFLKINFSNILSSCKLCHNITIKSVKCQACETPIHRHCLTKLFTSLKGRAKKCPNCSHPWVEPDE